MLSEFLSESPVYSGGNVTFPTSFTPDIFCDAAEEGYWNSQSLDPGTDVIVDIAGRPTFTRFQLVWERSTPALTREDVMVSHIDWCSAPGASETKLSSAERTSIITAIGTWWTTSKAFTCPAYTFREIRVYDYDPIDTRPGPPVQVSAVGTAGTSASGRLPDQVSVSVTYKTPSRKHWGRSYMPTLNQGVIDTTYGRLTNGHCTAVANAMRTLLQTTGSSGACKPVVASIGHRALLTIKELQVDNVPDIQRRRRVKQKSFAQSYTS
jgi:hypothetical protein